MCNHCHARCVLRRRVDESGRKVLPAKTAQVWASQRVLVSGQFAGIAGEMRALLPVFSTMLRFSPADVQRCQESATKWEAAAGVDYALMMKS